MNHTPLEDQVHDALHRRVDPMQHSPLTVTDVRRRAGRIQLRRRAAAGAVVAAALAVAVPFGISAIGPSQRSEIPPATQTPAPTVTGTVRIDPRSAPVGEELKVPLINVDEPSLTTGGETFELPRRYSQLTPYLDGWTGLTPTDDEGGWAVQVLDADFTVLDEVSRTSQISVSADGSRLAWTWYDGTRWVVVDRDASGAREERTTPMPPGPERARLRTIGFLPDDGLVLARLDLSTNNEAALVLSPDGTTTPLPGFIRPGSASPANGLVSGQTTFEGDGSCWQVTDAVTGSVVWDTCDYSVLAFSPNGQYVVGFTDYLTPDGSPTLAILDAVTGQRVVDFELVGARTGVVGINQEVVWEDDRTLVATLVTHDQQYVVRLGVDGTVERVGGDAVDVDPGARALKLATGAW